MSKKLYIIIILFILSSFKALSNDKIAYLQMDYIFNNTNIGKKIIEEIKKENKMILDDFKKQEEKLIILENDLKKKKNIISPEEFQINYKDLSSKIKLFRSTKNNALNEFELDKNKKISIFFDKINPILKEYMKTNSINIILDKKNIIIADKELDITKEFNDLINETMK